MKEFYKYQFDQLARKNKLILSTDAEPAFMFIQDNFDLVSFDNAMRSVGKTPALLLENYSYKFSTGNARNYWRGYTGRFDILDSATIGDQASIDEVQARCELIAEQIVKKLQKIFGEGGSVISIPGGDSSPKMTFDINETEIHPIGPVSTNYYGVTCGFHFAVQSSGGSNDDDWEE